MGPVLVPTICRYTSTDRVSLQYFTTHTDLVKRQQQAIRQRKAVRKGLQSDKEWTGDGFVKESESMWPSVHFRSRSIHPLCGSRSMSEAYRVRGRQLHEQELHLVPFLQNEYLHLVSVLLLVAG
ncbi:hypothetical protein BHE74_00021032 [Ensete ventricosum]|nr:hypothetical protein BHE74_00021032 [Ensete ventricosum]